MILFRQYDKENRIDKAWYDSSNIVYSECDDHINALKTLRIVFKTGDMYEYENVDVNDYLMFMAGWLDGSNGKAFYKFIRNKYDGNKLGPVNLEELKQKIESLKEQEKKDIEKDVKFVEKEENCKEQKETSE